MTVVLGAGLVLIVAGWAMGLPVLIGCGVALLLAALVAYIKERFS